MSHRPRPAATLALALSALALLVLGAACGVPTGSQVQPTDPDEVPFGLLDEDYTSPLGPPQASTTVTVQLYDDEDRVLRPVERAVPRGALAAVLAELEQGPTVTEGRLGLTSALDGTSVIGAVDVTERVATVDLNEQFRELGSGAQLVAIAQLVVTAAGQPGVDAVSFTLDGEDVEVPTGDGSVTGDAVDPSDFRSLLPAA